MTAHDTVPHASETLSHADLPSPSEMAGDCAEVSRQLRLERVARSAVESAPSLHFEDYPREVPKRDIRADDATARLAHALFG